MVYAMRSSVCLFCGEEFSRRKSGSDEMKFCSKSHAASFNNAARPPRDVAVLRRCETCPECGGRRSDSRKDSICRKCRKSADTARINAMTLQEVRDQYSVSQYHAKIRAWSRAAYVGEWACLDCGYSLHVDICHVRDVKDFPMSTTVGVVNDPNNLVALCKNHHWEFDNGFLSVSGILKERKGRVA